MNVQLFIAGIMALFIVVGHFAVGIRIYLRPLLEADLDPVVKATMQCVFHYLSAFLSLSALFLLLSASGVLEYQTWFVRFTGLNYLFFAWIQVIYAFKNRLPKPLVTLFQWTLFLPVGLLCLIS